MLNKILKTAYLYILMIATVVLVLNIPCVKIETPFDKSDRSDYVLDSLKECPPNNMHYNNNSWTIDDADPYVTVSGVNKYIYGVEINTKNNQDNLNISIYYNTGKGFSEKEVIVMDNRGNGVYKYQLKGNINDIRIDFENIEAGAEISDMTVTLHNGYNYYNNSKRTIILINIMLLIVCSVFIFLSVFVIKDSILTATIKVLIYSSVIALSEKNYFGIQNTTVFFLLVDICVVMACIFYSNDGNVLNDKSENEGSIKEDKINEE